MKDEPKLKPNDMPENECLCYLAWGETHPQCPFHGLKALIKAREEGTNG